jgi:hypothetical protein
MGCRVVRAPFLSKLERRVHTYRGGFAGGDPACAGGCGGLGTCWIPSIAALVARALESERSVGAW